MYKYLLAVLGICICFAFTYNNDTTTAVTTAKSIDNRLAKVKDGLYAWKTEVNNVDYAAFVTHMKATTTNWQQYAVDSSNWRVTDVTNMPYEKYYHTHAAFANYPVVNVTYNNAVAYCTYLTTLYNGDAKRKYKQVRFGLPTKAEWVYAATAGNERNVYASSLGFISSPKGKLYYNCANQNIVNKQGDSIQYFTAACNSYMKNKIGLYNCSGNVAEMVAEQGVAIGGSYTNKIQDCTVQSTKTYTTSTPDIGFRVFMQVVEE